MFELNSPCYRHRNIGSIEQRSTA